MLKEVKLVLDETGIQKRVEVGSLYDLKVNKNEYSEYYTGNLDNLFVKVYPNKVIITGDLSYYATKVYQSNMSLDDYRYAMNDIERKLGINLDYAVFKGGLDIAVNLQMEKPPLGYFNRIESCNGAVDNIYSNFGRTFCFGRRNRMYDSVLLTFREVAKDKQMLLQVELKLDEKSKLNNYEGRDLKAVDIYDNDIWEYFYEVMNEYIGLLVWKTIIGGSDIQSKFDVKKYILDNVIVSDRILRNLKKKIVSGYKKSTIQKTSYHKMEKMIKELSCRDEIDMQYDYRTELIAALRKEFDNLVFNTNELIEEGDINVNQ